jgi:hypothetical protein
MGTLGRGAAVATGGAAVGAFALLVRGALMVDLGVGRTLQPLGPFTVRIEAPRDVVFEIVSAPYLQRAPRAMAQKLRVVERGENMVLAEHFTKAGLLVTTTLETVRFEPPERVHFRLVRGPVPHVVERFALREVGDATELDYTGELGTDLWAVGRRFGAVVARRWEDAVRESLAGVQAEAERQAASAQARR